MFISKFEVLLHKINFSEICFFFFAAEKATEKNPEKDSSTDFNMIMDRFFIFILLYSKYL